MTPARGPVSHATILKRASEGSDEITPEIEVRALLGRYIGESALGVVSR